TLSALGSLAVQRNALDEAMILYRRAAERYAELTDQRAETRARNSLAEALFKQQRYDEARSELDRAIACAMAARPLFQPWTTVKILHDLEQSAGNTDAASQARELAINLYWAFRRAGGSSENPRASVFDRVRRALAHNKPTEIAELQVQLSAAEISAEGKAQGEALVAKLHAILRHDRDQELAQDPTLDYLDAVELRLLLEDLAKTGNGNSLVRIVTNVAKRIRRLLGR